MHLESGRAQEVSVNAPSLRVRFEAGETIHAESSITRLVAAGELALEARTRTPRTGSPCISPARVAMADPRPATTLTDMASLGETLVDLSVPYEHVTRTMQYAVVTPGEVVENRAYCRPVDRVLSA
jgi:hypothetical protein